VLNKPVFALSIIIAFVAGSIMTGTMAFGAEKPNGDPFKTIWNAINGLITTDESLQEQIDNLSTTGSGDTMYISENITCESREVGPTLFQLCTNTCDEGDEAVNVSTPGTEVQLDDFRPTGYRTVTFDVPPSFFKVLCIDWRD